MTFDFYQRWDNPKTHSALRVIKDNDGFLGQIDSRVRKDLLDSGWATVEVSELSGLDIQWTLTADGKKKIRELNAANRRRNKYPDTEKSRRTRSYGYVESVPVPLTVEVLDALKSIQETGDPGTSKLDILSRIQKKGTHLVSQTLVGKTYQNIYGSLAEFKNGVWALTDGGKKLAVAHIRKKDCAQFSGKVR